MRLTTSLRQVAAPIFNRTITPECEEKLKVLLENGWTVSKKRTAIEKGYQFNTFSRAMKFMRYVAKESQGVGHHPEWANVYNKVHVRWTTHNPSGLGKNDINMAEFCDKVVRENGLRVKQTTSASTLLEEMIAEGSECEPCAKADKSPKKGSLEGKD